MSEPDETLNPATSAEPAESAEPSLPDAPPDTSDEPLAKVKEMEDKIAAIQAEKDKAEKAAQAAKEKMYEVLEERAKQRKVEPDAKPQKTYEQYRQERLKAFEENPADAYGKLIDDFATDRELERQRFQAELKSVEERAYRRAMAANPEYAKEAEAAEKLLAERPDMSNMTLEQRMEYVRLQAAAEKIKKDVDNIPGSKVNVGAERELLSGLVNPMSRTGQRQKMPQWVNEPEVLQRAHGFKTKKELLDWRDATPEQAIAMARAAREKQFKETGV